MRQRLFKFLLIAPVLLLSAGVHAQQNQQTSVPKGQVVEKLVCLSDATQSYALYLPTGYTPDRKYPILYAFDPGARGKNAVERFKEAGEKFNWIVVGSNNSRNGSVADSIKAWNALVTDTRERFAVDDDRTYATGLSGGARTAIYIASRCHDCMAGVIACGAGFPVGINPSPDMHFAFVGIAGIDDFNFREVKALDEPLTKAGMVHRITSFEGRHEWPPVATATAAVEWLELQAIKAGKRARDDAFIADVWQRELQRARTLEESHHAYDAYQIYLGLADGFKGLRKVDDADQAARRLQDSREVKEAMRSEQQQIRKQGEIESQMNNLIASLQRIERDNGPTSKLDQPEDDRRNEESSNPEGRLQGLVAELRRQSKAADDSGERRVARRVLEGTFIGLIEQGMDYLQKRKLYDAAAITFKLASEINPDRPGVYFYLAWAHAANREKKKALAALKIAVEKGFSDLSLITGNEAFDLIRSDPQFQQIIQGLKKSDE